MEIPLRCFECGRNNYLDFDALERRLVQGERNVKQFGFVCDNCFAWEHSHFESTQISRRLKSIEKMDRTSKEFPKKLGWLWNKFDRLQERLQRNVYGSRRNKNLVKPG